MSLVIILDCGATNLRAIAIDKQGGIVASHYLRNETVSGLERADFHVWDFEQIWQKLSVCCREVMSKVAEREISAVSVTTFGVDGAPFDAQGNQIYPIISWKCPRTTAVMKQVEEEFDRELLYRENGIGDYSFNTLYKLKWLKDNQPEIHQQMDKFVFISSMITSQLSGVASTDRTMAGTSMLTNLSDGSWNQRALEYLELTTDHFAPTVNAGEVIGHVQQEAASETGLPEGVPIVSTGHDTQFALYGSGAQENQAFLSSGTWEILMARSQQPSLNAQVRAEGLTVELDSKAGLCNPAIQWLSSAVLEWVATRFYSDVEDGSAKYELMISEAAEVPSGCNGVRFKPSFAVDESGQGGGELTGLSINTTRGEIYRAALEGLAEQLRQSVERLTGSCQLKQDNLMVVGGGARNRLWNQIRADVLGRPIQVVEQPESTVIGAAMYAFAGVGEFDSPYAAQQAMKPSFKTVLPSQPTEEGQHA
ncbi:L-fuculokinase [Photobacterium satsumensis]|uniref:L-fuculokinase n=1 Tax=Photobacterium satsumensis TaxID=2910239 RepID=UPI003D12F7F9